MRRILIPFLIVVFLMAPGCMNKGYVKVSAIEGLVEKVSVRHDAYINADDSLSDLKKRVALRSTTLLRAVINEAKAKKEAEAEEE